VLIKMDAVVIENLEPPRFEKSKPLLMSGLGEHHSYETSAGIPALVSAYVDD